MNKTKKITLRKAMCYIMTVLMVMSCWVFTPIAQKASAATAGNYYVEVTWQLINNANDYSANYTGKSKTGDKEAGFSIFYKNNNGKGSAESEVYWSIGKKDASSYGGTYVSGTTPVVNGNMNNSDKNSPSYVCSATIAGFPTSLYAYNDLNNITDKGEYRIKKIAVGKPGTASSSLTTLWSGDLQLSTISNTYAFTLTTTSYSQDKGGSDSNNYCKNASWTWTGNMPKASTITAASISPTSVTCPTGSNTVTSTATLGVIRDQYGVNWYQDPYLSVAADPGITRTDNKTITVDSGAMTPASPWYRNVTIRVRAGSSSGTQVGSDLSLKVMNPSYTVTWKWYETNTSNPASPTSKTSTTTGVYYNQTPTAPTDKTNSYYTDAKHYTNGKFTPSKITGAQTFTMGYSSADHGKHNYSSAVTAPTATKSGYTKYTCAECGDTYYDAITNPTGENCTGTNLPAENVYFNVPETIYLTPGNTSFRYVLDQNMGSTGTITVNSGYKNISDGANIDFYYKNASGVSIKAESSDFSSLTLSTGTTFSLSNTPTAKGSKTLTSGSVNTSKSGYIKWTATYTDTSDGLQKTATAYTYVYAPYLSIVGAAGRAYHGDPYAQMINWWQGVQGTTGALPSEVQDAPKGYETTKATPGVYAQSADLSGKYLLPMTSGVFTTTSDAGVTGWLTQDDNGYDKNINFGNYHGGIWNDSVLTVVTGYLGVVRFDSSRVSNLSQIPNLKVGSMITDRANADNRQTYEIGYRTTNHEYYTGSFHGGGPDSGEFYNYCRNYSVGTSIYKNDSAPEGSLYNAAVSVPVSVGTNRIDLVGKLAGGGSGTYKNYDAGVTLYSPIDAIGTDKSALRTVVYNAQGVMAKYCANGSGSHIISGSEWSNFISAYDSAYKALTMVDGSADYTALKENLENKVAALASATKHHEFVSHAASSTNRAYITCVHCDYSTFVPMDISKDCTGVTTTKTPPTCTAPGKIVEKCSCGYTKETALSAIGHDYGSWVYDASTKKHTRTCANDSSHKETAACSFDTGFVTTAATCTSSGVKTFTCSVCGGTYTETIPATGHTAGAAATCETAQNCTVCGVTLASPLGHNWNSGTVTTQPGCTEEGEKTYTCQRTGCGETMTENVEALGHNITKVNEKAATCTNPGNVEYWHCSRCDKDFSDENGTAELENTATNPTGHTPGAAATCETAQTCTKCGTILASPLGHSYPDEWTVRTAATCTDTGIEYKTCIRGDKEITQVIRATGHNYGSWVYDASTKKHTKTCATDSSHKVTEACLFDSGVITKAATCTETGVKTYTCSACEGTYTESVAATGHSWSEPAWTWSGYTSASAKFTCSNDDSHTQTVTASISSNVTKTPNCSETGTKVYTATASFNSNSYTNTKTETLAEDSSNHKSVVTDKGYAATAVTVGLTDGSHCSACSVVIKTQQVIAALGHSATYEAGLVSEFSGEYEYVGVTVAEPSEKVVSTDSGVNSQAVGAFGKITIKDGKATYAVTTMRFTDVDIFWILTKVIDLPKQGDITYAYEKVTVVPSTSLYYEDDFTEDGITYMNGVCSDGSARYGQWTSGSSSPSTSTLDFNETYKSSDSATFSKGSAHQVTVSDLNSGNGNKNWPKAQFTFAGTGFDIVSLTDSQSGVFAISVYRGTDAAGKKIKSKIVDTYYGYSYGELYYRTRFKEIVNSADSRFDTYEDVEPLYPTNLTALPEGDEEYVQASANGKVYTLNPAKASSSAQATGWINDKLASKSETIYQVPVISLTGLDYDTYTVTVEARFMSAYGHYSTDAEGNKYYDLTLDAVRIYDPANTQAVKDAYANSGNGDVNYIKIKDTITGVEAVGSATIGSILIDGFSAIDTNNLSSYLDVSPNNELYLAENQSITFEINTDDFNDVLLGMREANGKAANVSVRFGPSVKTLTISSATEIYYSLADELGVSGSGTIVVTNNSDSILSLTNLKTVDLLSVQASASPMMLSAYTADEAIALLCIDADQPGDDNNSDKPLSGLTLIERIIAIIKVFLSTVLKINF